MGVEVYDCANCNANGIHEDFIFHCNVKGCHAHYCAVCFKKMILTGDLKIIQHTEEDDDFEDYNFDGYEIIQCQKCIIPKMLKILLYLYNLERKNKVGVEELKIYVNDDTFSNLL